MAFLSETWRTGYLLLLEINGINSSPSTFPYLQELNFLLLKKIRHALCIQLR